MYFSRAAIVLVSIPAFLFSASSVLADELSELTAQPTVEESPVRSAQHTLQRPTTFLSQVSNTPSPINLRGLPLSPGDRLKITIPGIGGEEFNGEYEVGFNGDLTLPLLAPIPVQGLVPTAVEARLRDVLLKEQYFLRDQLRVSVQVLDYSPIQVAVTGEVFEPGRILLAPETFVTTEVNGEVVELPGDYPVERYLTSALKAIGGVKPTADVSQVQVLRGTQSILVDLSGIFSGSSVADFPLIADDQIIIPNAGEIQSALIRPSQITPDSIDLYVSNVTQPGGGAVLTGTGQINAASFEYGTNLAQALISARCVGGTRATNANRRAVLIQTNSTTGGLTTSEYKVNDLVSNATQSSKENPFLMPDDAIACYDSRNTNLRGILGTVVDFINPINLLLNLFDNDN